MCEHGRRAFHTEGHDGPNIRPKQLRNREIARFRGKEAQLKPDEPTNRLEPRGQARKEFGEAAGPQGRASGRRASPRPYKADGTDKLAQHSAVRGSVPEINGPVVQREFTFLLRETCKRAPSETAGARVSNGPRAFAGVSRGRSTESNEPGNTGGPHNSGRAELGRQNTTTGGLVPGTLKPTG